MVTTLVVLMISVAALACSRLQISAAQTTHVVGGATGWTVPSAGSDLYAGWSASQTFNVGDILGNQHNVVHATKESYAACSTNCLPIIAIYSTTPPVKVTLDTPGENYFFCSVDNHCTSGQKFSINVIGASSPSSSPASSPELTPFPIICRSPPRPPPGSAASPAIKGLFLATTLCTLMTYLLD